MGRGIEGHSESTSNGRRTTNGGVNGWTDGWRNGRMRTEASAKAWRRGASAGVAAPASPLLCCCSVASLALSPSLHSPSDWRHSLLDCCGIQSHPFPISLPTSLGFLAAASAEPLGCIWSRSGALSSQRKKWRCTKLVAALQSLAWGNDTRPKVKPPVSLSFVFFFPFPHVFARAQ